MNNEKPLFLEKLNQALLIVTILTGYVILLAAAYFSHPNAEDFSLTAEPFREGILNSMVKLHLNYDGRYFTNLLHAINPMAFGYLKAYPYIIMFGIIFSVFSLFYFLKPLHIFKTTRERLIFSALFFLVAYALSSSLVHLVYWMVSSFVYLYSFAFTLLFLGTFLRGINEKFQKKRVAYFSVSYFLLTLCMGMNEMFLVINLFSIIILFGWLYHKSKIDKTAFTGLVIVWTICFLFFISNPGIKTRLSGNLIEYNDFNAHLLLFRSLKEFTVEFSRVVFSGGLFLISIFIVSSFRLNIKLSKVYFLLILIGFAGVYFSTLAFYIPMGHEENLPVRMYSIINVLILLLLFSFGMLFFSTKKLRNILEKLKFKYIKPFFIIGLPLFLFFTKNNLSQIKQELMNGEIYSFHQKMLEHYDVLKAGKKNDECWTRVSISDFPSNYPSIFHEPVIEPNRTTPHWNKAYEKYLDIDEVVLESDTVYLSTIINQLL